MPLICFNLYFGLLAFSKDDMHSTQFTYKIFIIFINAHVNDTLINRSQAEKRN